MSKIIKLAIKYHLDYIGWFIILCKELRYKETNKPYIWDLYSVQNFGYLILPFLLMHADEIKPKCMLLPHFVTCHSNHTWANLEYERQPFAKKLPRNRKNFRVKREKDSLKNSEMVLNFIFSHLRLYT